MFSDLPSGTEGRGLTKDETLSRGDGLTWVEIAALMEGVPTGGSRGGSDERETRRVKGWPDFDLLH
eukprot:218190-Amorphochlora_amoeboformis.AAC.2